MELQVEGNFVVTAASGSGGIYGYGSPGWLNFGSVVSNDTDPLTTILQAWNSLSNVRIVLSGVHPQDYFDSVTMRGLVSSDGPLIEEVYRSSDATAFQTGADYTLWTWARPGGSSIIAYGNITFTFSSGCTLPDLTGMQVADAVQALTGAGFVLGDVDSVSDTAPENEVLGQFPLPGVQACGASVDLTVSAGPACFDCTIVNSNQTLATLRTRLARRLGFSAQATNLPPGAAELFDEFLISAQTFLYREYPALETRRIFQWQCVEGQRFYGLQDSEGNPCDLRFDPYKNIEGAYVIDEGGTWMPLVNGIKPTFYTSLSQQGLPAFYEIRQCLEIFPAPSSSGYSVAIKGHFGLQPFEADDDQTTIDSELVFLWALANALDYYQKPSAAIWQQAQRYLSQLVAGTHGSRRYIPGKRLPPPAIQPRPVGGWD